MKHKCDCYKEIVKEINRTKVGWGYKYFVIFLLLVNIHTGSGNQKHDSLKKVTNECVAHAKR
jgi:hypothetical protein